MTKRDQDSAMTKAAGVVLNLASTMAYSPEEKAAIEKVRKVFDPEIGYMGLTDDEAGRYMKWIGSIALGYAKQEFDDRDGTGTALTTMGVLQLLRRMFDADAHHGTFELTNTTFGGKDGGSWRVTVEKLDENGDPISLENEQTTTMTKPNPITPDVKATVSGTGRA